MSTSSSTASTPKMDFRTYVFLFATLSVCINTFVCVVTTLPIPGFK